MLAARKGCGSARLPISPQPTAPPSPVTHPLSNISTTTRPYHPNTCFAWFVPAHLLQALDPHTCSTSALPPASGPATPGRRLLVGDFCCHLHPPLSMRWLPLETRLCPAHNRLLAGLHQSQGLCRARRGLLQGPGLRPSALLGRPWHPCAASPSHLTTPAGSLPAAAHATGGSCFVASHPTMLTIHLAILHFDHTCHSFHL